MVKIKEQNVYGIIYKITNTINGKVYIGQTTEKYGFRSRYRQKGVGIERVYKYHKHNRDCNKGYNSYLLRSIEKYGFDAFVVDEVFDTANSREELNNKEIYYIKYFNSFENGYNLTLGGEGSYGMHKLSGKESPMSRSICQISRNGKLIKVWGSISEAAKKLGINRASINCVCKGQRATAGDFVWVYEDEYDECVNYAENFHTNTNIKNNGSVVLLDENNENIIQEYKTLREASRQLNMSTNEISCLCRYNFRKNSEKNINIYFKNEYEYLREQRLNKEGSINCIA